MPGIKIPAFIRSGLDRRSAPWGREVEDRIKALERAAARGSQDELHVNKGQSATLTRLGQTVREMPFTDMGLDTITGFGLSAGWNTYATFNITVPEGKTYAEIFAFGNAAAVDLTTGGLTNAYMRLQIAGSTSQQFSAAKDAGVSAVNNVMSGGHVRSWTVSPGDLLAINLQINPLNAAAFSSSPGNYATLVAIALFTNPD